MHVWSDLFFALMVPLLPLIKEDMDLSFKEVGLLRLLFTGAAAVLQIPAGFLAEITGEFWLLVLGNAWVAAGLVGMGLAPTFAVLAVSTFLGGLGGGTQHPLGSSMVSRAYDTGGRSTAVGTVNFAGDLGKLVAPALAGGIAVFYGWRSALWVIGAAGIFFMVVATMYRRRVAIGKPESGPKGGPVIESKNTRMGGFISLSGIGMLDSAARGGALVFLPFVMDDKGLSIGQISALLMFLFAGGAAGKFVCGWMDDRYGSVLLIRGTKGLTALLLVLSLPAPVWAMAPLLLALGVGLNGTSSVLYSTVAEFVPPSRRARLYGVYYTTNEGSTALAPLCYGVIADLFSLNVAIVVMGIATAAILPASLTLIRHLDREPRT
jgi:MFS family permease